jgi:hypothetical protein
MVEAEVAFHGETRQLNSSVLFLGHEHFVLKHPLTFFEFFQMTGCCTSKPWIETFNDRLKMK